MSICSKIVKNKTLCNIRNIKHIKMKKLFKIITVLFIGLIIYSCSEEESQNDVSQNTKEELFAKKTFEIYEELRIEEQLEVITEAATIIVDEFVEVNKTVIMG